MALTIEQAKALSWNSCLKDSLGKKWRVNGRVKTWKRDAGRVQVPIKHGLYAYGYVTEDNLHLLTLTR